MLRGIIYALVSILVLTFLRSVIGIITKGLSDAMKEEGPQSASSKKPAGPKGGELVKCPVCGTYFAPEFQHRKVKDGKLHLFCSEKCMEKFAA
jgi:YHS domain-containing protein